MICRRMEEKDLEQVCWIENHIFSKPWSRDDFFSSFKNKNNIYIVAEKEEEILGYCGLWGVVGEGQINNVAVKEEARGRGVGYKLLARLIEEGRADNMTAFTLEVRESNIKAISLYMKLGFDAVGVRKEFYDAPKENAIIMWLQ